MGFDHLQLSTSRVHRNYRPFTEKSIFLLQRIMKDLIGPESNSKQTINDKEMQIISKILCDPKLAEFLFKDSKEVAT